jgi:hypothetical protein
MIIVWTLSNTVLMFPVSVATVKWKKHSLFSVDAISTANPGSMLDLRSGFPRFLFVAS